MTRTVRSAPPNGGRATGSGKSFLKLVLMMIVLLVVARPADCQDQGGKTALTPTKITPGELHPGDVLLYHFNNTVGQLILVFQGGDYNHASIYDGKQVLEATDQGIIKDELDKSVKNAEYVDIYRLCEGKRCIGDSGFDSAPVTNWIDKFANAGGFYAYDELFLLAGICFARRSGPILAPIRFILDPILGEAIQRMNKIIANRKCIMICSELVYRCFAGAGERYVLKVPHFLATESAGPLTAQEKQFVAEYKQARENCPIKSASHDPQLPIPNFVTPRDLHDSNLRFVGRLAKDS